METEPVVRGTTGPGSLQEYRFRFFRSTFCCSQAVCLVDPFRYRQLADLQQLIEFIECLLKAIQFSLAQFAGE